MPTIPSQWQTKIPSNMNPLAPSGFRFLINKLPKMQFFCQTVNLPSITLGEATFATPFSNVPVPGDKLEFGELSIQFLVDETLENYKAIHEWLFGLGFPINNQQYTEFLAKDTVAIGINSEYTKNTSDASLFILTNNNTESKIVTFLNVFPTSLESVTFTAIDTDVQYLIGNATFRYNYYKFDN
jgi:hypothetical protein